MASPSNFAFLQGEWPDLDEAASRAEALELMARWLYKHAMTLTLP